jgi:hypothetical protein
MCSILNPQLSILGSFCTQQAIIFPQHINFFKGEKQQKKYKAQRDPFMI